MSELTCDRSNEPSPPRTSRTTAHLIRRIRFHGRGGQGMKTASRILGSAAFQAGWIVQDSPIYGAERRGAPIAAFTRIANAPILERGAIATPDLVVVADDTLLAEPAAQPLAGCDSACTVLLNSYHDADDIPALANYHGRILTANFTTLALEMTETLASLSTALSIAAAYLVGITCDESLSGLESELSLTHLSASQRQTNYQLARAVYAQAQSWEPLQDCDHGPEPPAPDLVKVRFAPPTQAASSIYATSNSPQRHTGSWRQFRPVLQPEKCTRCWLCFVWCPEAAISLAPDELPVVDYDVCKGCLLCAHECPTHAFRVEKEV